MDVKKLGRIPDGGGWRAHGRASGSIRRDHQGQVGYDYVHALVDDHSRLAYAEVLPDERGVTCAAFLERAIGFFAAHGITRIERLLTDIQTRSCVSDAPVIGRWCEDTSARPPSAIVV